MSKSKLIALNVAMWLNKMSKNLSKVCNLSKVYFDNKHLVTKLL